MKNDTKFSYVRENGRDHIAVHGLSFSDIAIEIAYIARKFYSVLMRRDPKAAHQFRCAVTQAILEPITWDISGSKPPELEILIPDKK